MDEKQFEFWAIVELFGHTTIAGYVQSLGDLIRVDVPSVGDQKEFTKYYGIKAIYGITPTTEENAKCAAASLQARPISLYLLPDPKPLRPALQYDRDPEDPGEPGDDPDCPMCGCPLDECVCTEDDDIPV